MAMIEAFTVTLFPTLFLIVLFGGEALFRRKNINQDGDPPIDKTLFYVSKYSIPIVWGAMVLHSWDISFSFIKVPELVKWIVLCLWIVGFVLLFIGRFGLGTSFRLGSPQENTRLKENGLFSLTRNPMYVGMYATLFASVFYTLNPITFFIVIFVIAVHHKIVLAEEQYLHGVFGEAYTNYCDRVRRYL